MKHIDMILPAISVVILDNQQKILLQRRADSDVWALPSGHIEPGESVAAAAVREILEETSLKVCVEKVIGIYSDPVFQVYTYPDGTRKHFITTCLLCRIESGELQFTAEESRDYQFFSVSSLPENMLSMHPDFFSDVFSENPECYLR